MQDCYVDNNALIEEKTSLKHTHIGPNVTIESKTRISQSVLMESANVKQRFIFKIIKLYVHKRNSYNL